MNCKQAQREIALWAGHDLDDASQKESVRRHVTGCPCCRAHYQRMKRTLHVLERAERPVTYVTGDSLWPVLASRISHAQQRASTPRNTRPLRSWMPFVAMTAAGFILLLVLNEQPPGGTVQRGFSPAPIFSAEGPSPDRYLTLPEYQSVEERHADDEILRFHERRMQQLRHGF
ncbi:MAG: anti-sigma factor [Planctomycetaceae bacterium]